MIDPEKILPGDSLTIHATARSRVHAGIVHASLSGHTGTVEFDFKVVEIATHEQRLLVRGDKVWGLQSKENGTVIHAQGDLAWVQFDDGRHEVVLYPGQVERIR